MKEKKLHSIFEQTDCLGRQNMLAYIMGELSVNEQYQFEKHLNSCSLCYDEFEGLLAMQDSQKLPIIVNELNLKIDDSVNRSLKKPFLKRYRLMRIAAMVVILISSGFFINYYLQYSAKEYYDNEMVSQSFEEPADEIETVVADSFIMPGSKETIPVVEEKKEFTEADNKSLLNKSQKLANEEQLEKTNTLSDIGDDEDTYYESDKDETIVNFDDKTKFEDQPTLVEENRGEGLSDENNIVSKVTIAEEEAQENEDDNVYDEIAIVKERKQDNNIGRSKLRSNKKTKSKGYLASYQQSGIDAFNDGNYREANIALNNSVKYEGKEDKTVFYLGQTYSAQGDSKKALLNYNKLLKNKNNKYQNEALWEKAKLLIKMEKRKSAINVLKDLVKVNSPFKFEAQHKLDSLLSN